ncbi:GNAT family N-acetyltransferase [Pantoea stewartii]|uniref:Acyltransferase superfamily protein n=1 Tax=Pantoea stewartii TaxID=66269 RepID=A0AB34VC89_9GAMM|nr:GNAT family N-acetyltransferase [Pantoea stewartii]KTS75343.1 acyltransferase superfamily protein [Pantoea stewartii]KTS95267.1 acyltransferase superfamily protein [Pantoea stewartii]KTT08336.1 acyltransferase superfamily protein [Pantoea stewartii]QIE97763.1 N-acetyltransferase [Pantoea stewartii]
MSLFTLSTLSDIPAAEWDALLPDDQPFLRHAFLLSLEDSGSVRPARGWQPAHLVWREQGELCAALPGYQKSHSQGEYVFDHAWADACQRAGIAYYPKWLGAIPFSPVTGARVLGKSDAAIRLLSRLPDWLERQTLSGAHINFTDSHANALLAEQPDWLARLGCQYHWHNRGYRDFQDFLDTLMSRKRKQLRKEREQVALNGFEFDWYRGDQLREDQWDFVYTCYANTYAVRGQRPYLTRAFFSLLAARLPENIRVVIARLQQQPAAMAFYLKDGESLYGRYWGCLAEFNQLHFETCFYQGMDFAIAEGLQRFDAGAQGEHKLVRGFEPQITHSWHYLCHPGLRAAVDDFLQQERQGVHLWAEEARDALPYRRGD